MTSRHTEGKVRDFEMTIEDAARLAECFNSFDDSDSWPGGFTQGNPYTAQRIFDDLSKRKNLRIIVAVADDKIVGHCNLAYPERDPESSYVGLLGVNPNYQGQGYGKALLIEAAETAAQFDKRRVDLHTWGGNLKAVPLYKRTGYNWVPATRVLMESHIPGIIGCPLFKEFFERHYWYDVFKPDVKQEMDDIVDDGIGVFKYPFEADNGDSLEVTVDREAKGICGFVLTMDGKTISADVRPESHKGHIGFGKVPAKLVIQNQSDEPLAYSVLISPDDSLAVDIVSPTSGTIEVGKIVEIKADYEILPKTDHLDRESIADIKIDTQAEWSLTLGGKSINLYAGIIPNEAISLTMGPKQTSFGINESKSIILSLKNNTERKLEGKLVLTPKSSTEPENRVMDFSIPENRDSHIPLTIKSDNIDNSSLISFEVSIYVSDDGRDVLVNNRSLNLSVIGSTGALVYEDLDNHYILETESFLVRIMKIPPMVVDKIIHKVSGNQYGGWALMPHIGYPFTSGGSEWDRKRFDVTLRNEGEFAEIELAADSIERPGMRFSIMFRAYAGREYMTYSTRFTNLGTTTLKDMGIRVGGWMAFYFDQMHIPLNNEIYRLNSCDWHGYRQIPKSPEYYHEGWSAMTQADGSMCIGYIWNQECLKEIIPKRSWGISTFEYTLPDLAPGDIHEQKIFNLMIGHGDWKKVHALWARLNGLSLDNEEPRDIRSDLEMELVRAKDRDGTILGSPVLLDRSTENELEVRVRVLSEEPMSGDIVLRLPNGLTSEGSKEIQIKAEDISIKSSFKKPIMVTVEATDDWILTGGEMKFIGGSRIDTIPITAILYDSKVDVEKQTEPIQGLELRTLISGRSRIAVSADYAGTLTKFGPVGEESYFYDTFPEAKPYIWWDKHYSGVMPVIWSTDVWDWESGLSKEKWSMQETTSGNWKGYELRSTLEHSIKLQGVETIVRFLQLNDAPAVYSEIRAVNKTPQWKELYLGFRGSPRLNGKSQSWIHSIANGTPVDYQPTDSEADVRVSPDAGWAAFREPESGMVLGVVSTCHSGLGISADNLGANAQMIWVRERRLIPPNAETRLSCYYLAAPSVESVRYSRGLPALD